MILSAAVRDSRLCSEMERAGGDSHSGNVDHGAQDEREGESVLTL